MKTLTLNPVIALTDGEFTGVYDSLSTAAFALFATEPTSAFVNLLHAEVSREAKGEPLNRVYVWQGERIQIREINVPVEVKLHGLELEVRLPLTRKEWDEANS